MTNPPTPPTEVPPMPKADRVTKMAAYFVDGGCSSFSCWKRKDGTTSIEQWGEQGWSKAAEATKEVERLREIIDEARSIAFCEYPKATDGFAPWKDCGDCVGCKVRAALTPKETIDD